MIALILALGFVALVIAGMLLYHTFSWGLVCWKFWAWFLIPIFPSLSEIGFLQAAGLMFFNALFRNRDYSPSIKKEYKEKHSQWPGFLAPWVTLLIGYGFYAIFL